MKNRLTVEQRAENEHRAERGAEIVGEYRDRWDRDEPTETVLTDLLADLMHFCDTPDAPSFDSMIETARTHHDAERAGVL